MSTPTPVYPHQQPQPQPPVPPTFQSQPLAPQPAPQPLPAVQAQAAFQPQPPVPLPAYEQPAAQPAAAPAAPEIPEGGYARRFVTVRLREFDLPGIECSVRLRNPGMMSQGAMEGIQGGIESIEGVEIGPDGKPDISEEQAQKAMPSLYRELMRLIAGWTMWDADSLEDNPPLLPSPPTEVEDLKRAPGGALARIMDAVKELSDPQ